MPMQAYAMNRKGRVVGKVFLAVIWAVALYRGWVWIQKHIFELLTVILIALSVYWVTRCIDQAGNLILKRLEILQKRVNSIESKLDRLERTIRKAKSETEGIQTR